MDCINCLHGGPYQSFSHGAWTVCFDGQDLSQAPLSGFIIMEMNMVPETLTTSTKGDFLKCSLINSPFNENWGMFSSTAL